MPKQAKPYLGLDAARRAVRPPAALARQQAAGEGEPSTAADAVPSAAAGLPPAAGHGIRDPQRAANKAFGAVRGKAVATVGVVKTPPPNIGTTPPVAGSERFAEQAALLAADAWRVLRTLPAAGDWQGSSAASKAFS